MSYHLYTERLNRIESKKIPHRICLLLNKLEDLHMIFRTRLLKNNRNCISNRQMINKLIIIQGNGNGWNGIGLLKMTVGTLQIFDAFLIVDH